MAQFRTAEEAWFSLIKEVRKGKSDGAARDVFKVVEHLFQTQRLSREDLIMMGKWGQNRMVPDAFHHGDLRLWREAMRLIGMGLKAKGIIE